MKLYYMHLTETLPTDEANISCEYGFFFFPLDCSDVCDIYLPCF